MTVAFKISLSLFLYGIDPSISFQPLAIYRLHVSSFLSKTRESSKASSPASKQLYGRKVPTSNFDLDSILNFEAELEEKEKERAVELQKQNETPNGNEVNYDNDDDNDFFMENEDIQTFEVPPELNEKRIDAILFELDPSISRSQYGTLISDGMVAISIPIHKDGDENANEYDMDSRNIEYDQQKL